jgi:hypothetical protein
VPPAEPRGCDGDPNRHVLPAGTTLWRLHRRDRRPELWNDVPDDVAIGGGRFSSTADCRYPFLYLTFAPQTALAERLLRSLPFPEQGPRLVPRAGVVDRRLTMLATTGRLILLPLLTTPDLAAVCQDEWLVHTGPHDYALTRRWAHWLRTEHPWTQGLIWPSRCNLGESAAVLFGDRCPPGTVQQAGPHRDLDDSPGTAWLNIQLAPYGAAVAPCPRPPSPG